jgi:glycosyltransferase involved in cell wall biosynthesis
MDEANGSALDRTRTKILFLHAEVMGYTISTLRSLTSQGAEVHVVAWDSQKLTKYETPRLDNVTFYHRSDFNAKTLLALAERIQPEITVVSGWQDAAYVRVSFGLRRRGWTTVTGLDTQWKISPKFFLAAILGKAGLFRAFYSHAWVPGPRQFEAAKRLGYRNESIITDLYAADLELFGDATVREFAVAKEYPHVFLFVGRLVEEKGLRDLLAAWSSIAGSRKDWTLMIVGDGKLRNQIPSDPSIVHLSFLQPEDLAREVSGSGCFILPSKKKP